MTDADPDVRTLSTRITALEGRVQVLEQSTQDNTRELRANTELTKQVHEATFGMDEAPGIHMRVEEMYEIFDLARNGFRYIGKAGNLVANAIAWLSKNAQRIFWVIALAAAAITYMKTGKWELPRLPE